uniref:Uncharacterized protein n=1 Tax=Amphimedon queenslandica TaxID=400682 RepID=A0A1X7VWF0_AMPQE
PNNIAVMCQSVHETAATYVSAVQSKAQEICDKFTDLFLLFANCHIYDSNSILTGSKIEELEVAIDSFLKYHREQFPSAYVLPKMHMLEDHIISWVKNGESVVD